MPRDWSWIEHESKCRLWMVSELLPFQLLPLSTCLVHWHFWVLPARAELAAALEVSQGLGAGPDSRWWHLAKRLHAPWKQMQLSSCSFGTCVPLGQVWFSIPSFMSWRMLIWVKKCCRNTKASEWRLILNSCRSCKSYFCIEIFPASFWHLLRKRRSFLNCSPFHFSAHVSQLFSSFPFIKSATSHKKIQNGNSMQFVTRCNSYMIHILHHFSPTFHWHNY